MFNDRRILSANAYAEVGTQAKERWQTAVQANVRRPRSATSIF
jgi:hypothetical protein